MEVSPALSVITIVGIVDNGQIDCLTLTICDFTFNKVLLRASTKPLMNYPNSYSARLERHTSSL